MLEIAFVMSPRQNLFFGELVEVIRDELQALGVPSTLELEGFPAPRPGRVYMLVPPHEYVRLSGEPPPDLLARTIVLGCEQPGTWFFDRDVEIARGAGAAFDISSAAVREWHRRGVAAEHFALGRTARWDRGPFGAAEEHERDIDVLFVGTRSDRRERLLAHYAGSLWRLRCHLVVAQASRPHDGSAPDALGGEAKRDLLARSKVLLNLHVGERPYFETLRATEAILAGAVLVSEPSPDLAPLRPGTDLLCGRAETLGLLAQALLEDDGRRRAMQRAAYDVLASRPLAAAVERLAAAAERVDAAAPLPMAGWRPAHPPPVLPAEAAPVLDADPEAAATRRALKQVRLEVLATRRRLDRLQAQLGEARPPLEVAAATPAWRGARARVSVLLTVFDYEQHVAGALDSVAAGSQRSLEIVVVDDASSDRSVQVVERWIRAHPRVPALLVRHGWNRGLPHARNTALGFARGDFGFVLDADNAVYPNGIERLVAALDAEQDADFAYGVLACFDASGPRGLTSVGPWDPARLRVMNYIDAMALIRLRALRALGGYATDERLHGWEDYDLWCRMANIGRRGVSVPEIVGRYRVAEHSMVRGLTAISVRDAFSVLIERSPQLMAGVSPPP